MRAWRWMRWAMLLALGSQQASAEPTSIARPRPVPTAPSSLPPLPPATYDPALQVGGTDIKARKVESRLSVDVLIDGRGPYRFIVDSGADSSVIGAGLARALQLPLGTPATLHGMTASAVVDRVRVGSLTLGPTTVRNLELPALSEADIGGSGIVGLDTLVEQRLLMDFDAKLIRVEDGRSPVRALPGEIVVVARRRRGQLIMTGVRANNQRLDAIIDTGSQITIGNLALRDRLIRKGRTKITSVPMTGVTGTTLNVDVAIVDQLEVGPILLSNVPMAFVDAPPFALFGLGDQPALLLGTDLMSQFRRVSLDFRARKVRFQLRRCTTEGLVLNINPEFITRISSAAGARACE